MSLATEVAGKLNYLNDKDKATVNALAPYSGYLSVQKKMDTFVFNEDAGFTYKMADKNRFLKFGDTVVDTYGPELVTNGDFSDSLGIEWQPVRGSANSVENDTLKVVNGSIGTGLTEYRTLQTIAGKTYIIKFTCVSTEGVFTALVRDGINYSGNVLYNGGNLGSNPRQIEIEVTATTTSMYLLVGHYGGTEGQVAYFDNISVREIQSMNFEECVPVVAEIIS